MKIIKYLFLMIIIFSISCKDGDVGPAGAKGPQGPAGKDYTEIGPRGDRGPSGDRGERGDKGPANTVAGEPGITNFIVSDWQSVKWEYMGTNKDGGNLFLGTAQFSELTQKVLDEGYVIPYLQVRGRLNTQTPYEASSGFPMSLELRRNDGTLMDSFSAYFDGFRLNTYRLVVYDEKPRNESIETSLEKLERIETVVRIRIIMRKP